MKKSLLLLFCLSSLTSFAEGVSGSLKIYGEVNNFAEYQNRSGYTDETGLYYLLPYDKVLNQVNMDLGNISSMNCFNLASKLGVNWSGYKTHNLELGARIEGDFFAFSGSSTVLRLRKAFFLACWDFNKWGKLGVKAGQDFHPFAEEKPYTLTLACGAPFNPFSYAPALKVSYSYFGLFGIEKIGLDVAALWQSDFCSNGPGGYSSTYIQRACCPEFFVGANIKWRFLTFKAGADFLTIKPRSYGYYPNTKVIVFVNDLLRTRSFFAFLEAKFNNLTLKAKSVLAESGEHLLLMGGYGLDSTDEDGNCKYTPYRTSSSWGSADYAFHMKKDLSLSVGAMAGYIRNLGTKDALYSGDTSNIYYNNDIPNLMHAIRLSPSFSFKYKVLKLGAEYEFTGAKYGDSSSIKYRTGLASSGFRWVYSHRFSIVLGCSF